MQIERHGTGIVLALLLAGCIYPTDEAQITSDDEMILRTFQRECLVQPDRYVHIIYNEFYETFTMICRRNPKQWEENEDTKK